MARKQTLKSLLGGNDSRVDVDLNLDERVFQAPTVKAGTYSVSQPVYARTNNLSELSDALQRYSGPLLRGYAEVKEQQSIAMADAQELLTTEQLKQLESGDLSGIQESINDTANGYDEAQRKRLISFTQNPNNYTRAYERVGERVAGVFTADYLANMQEYAENEDFNFDNEKRKLADEYGLNGLALQKFEEKINNINASTKAQFDKLKNDAAQVRDKASIVTTAVLDVKNGTYTDKALNDSLAGKTLKESEDIIKSVLVALVEETPTKATTMIKAYEDNVFTLGNAPHRPEFVDELEIAVANEKSRLSTINDIEIKANKESMTEAFDTVNNSITREGKVPEKVNFEINGVPIELDTKKSKTIEDVYKLAAESVFQIEDKRVSEGTKQSTTRFFYNKIEEKKDELRDFKTLAGLEVADSQMESLFKVKGSDKEYIYDVKNGEDIISLVAEKRQELSEELNKVYNDNSLDSTQKSEQARAVRKEFMVEINKVHEQFVTDKEKSIREIKFEQTTGGDQEKTYQGIFDNFYASTVDTNTALMEGQSYLEKAREFDAETDRLRNEILDREMTAKETKAGMTSEDLYQEKIQEAKTLNENRSALLQADLAADNEFDGRTKDSQQPKKVLKNQEGISKELVNVSIGEGDSGFASIASPTKTGPYGIGTDAIYVKGLEVKNLVEDINTTKGFGTEFKIGFFDNLRLDFVTASLPEQVDTIHKANQHRAIKFQQKGEEYMKASKGQSVVAEFVSGETITRVVRDGKAGMTLGELGKANLEGVSFDPTLLDQSAIPILPFNLVNKAMTDQDSLTPQEESEIRDYADLLYDSGELDEAGKTIVLQKLIELQANAYAQIGFRFAK